MTWSDPGRFSVSDSEKQWKTFCYLVWQTESHVKVKTVFLDRIRREKKFIEKVKLLNVNREKKYAKRKEIN